MFRRRFQFATALLGLVLLAAAKAPAAEPQFASRFSLVPLDVVVQALAVGDVNGDGHLDLACTHTGQNIAARDSLVRIYLGDGRGGFTQKADYGVGSGPIGLTLGDFDRDGKADLKWPGGRAGS